MTLEICRGTPQFTGRYVCYMPGVTVPTVIRFWLPGTGWLNNLKEPVEGDVAGWIGPLPVFPENCVSIPKPAFDL